MSILPDSRYEKIHTGSSIETKRLQTILEENNIPSILRDDNESAKLAGYALASPDCSRLLVDKGHVVRAKHLISMTLNEFEEQRISDEELESLSQEKPVHEAILDKNVNLHPKAPKPPKTLMLLYVGYLMYAAWRLYPIIVGIQEPDVLRILITGGLSVFCIYRLVTTFKK